MICLAAVFAVAGCDLSGFRFPIAQTPAPLARPDRADPPPRTRSAESLALERYYAELQADLLELGLLRTDGTEIDVPFTRRNLVENFLRIALFNEITIDGDGIVAQPTANALRRWERPIRVRILFGDLVSPAQRETDQANIRRYLVRLSRLTGRSIRLSDQAPNYFVLILTQDEQRVFGAELNRLLPELGGAPIREITEMPRSIFCSVYAVGTPADPNTYVAAVAVIRAEHPDALRLSCIHEEIAQGLGLPNDSPSARPSVFNDDEEFGLLTRHDEYLLRMLYDDRMRTGLTEREARPIAEEIASELLGESS